MKIALYAAATALTLAAVAAWIAAIWVTDPATTENLALTGMVLLVVALPLGGIASEVGA